MAIADPNRYLYSPPGFTYNTAGQYPYQTPQASYQIPTNQQSQIFDINWIQGEDGAKAFRVNPGHTAILMDSQDSVFYMKAIDLYGVPSPMRKFRFTEEVSEPEKTQQPKEPQMSQEEIRKMVEEIVSQKLEEFTK